MSETKGTPFDNKKYLIAELIRIAKKLEHEFFEEDVLVKQIADKER